jgi:hypothetical protein
MKLFELRPFTAQLLTVTLLSAIVLKAWHQPVSGATSGFLSAIVESPMVNIVRHLVEDAPAIFCRQRDLLPVPVTISRSARHDFKFGYIILYFFSRKVVEDPDGLVKINRITVIPAR